MSTPVKSKSNAAWFLASLSPLPSAIDDIKLIANKGDRKVWKLNEYKICFLVNQFLLCECRHMIAVSPTVQV